MKYVSVLFALLLSSFCLAQEKSKWLAGIAFSTDNVKVRDTDNNSFFIRDVDDSDVFVGRYDRYNFTVGVIARREVYNNLSFISGLMYANKDFSAAYSCGSCLQPQPLSFIDGSFRPPTFVKIQQSFVVVPLGLDYTFIKTKIQPAVQAGINNNLFLVNDLKELSNSYFMEAFAGGSVKYNYSEQWVLEVGYRYNSSITKIYPKESFKFNTQSIVFQVYYQF